MTYIPTPPKELYEPSVSHAEQIRMPVRLFVLQNDKKGNPRVEYPESGGIFAYFVNALYPQKGWPDPDTLWAVNAVKKITKLVFFDLSKVIHLLLPGRRKRLERLLAGYVDTCAWIIENSPGFRMKDRYFMRFSKGLDFFIRAFFINMGFSLFLSTDIGLIFRVVFENDDTYRLRVQDGMSETLKERMMARPAREMWRVIKIIEKREFTGTRLKFKTVRFLLCLALLFPSIKRAFRVALSYSYFSDFQFDKADRYWVLPRDDYNYLGRTKEDRTKEFIFIHPAGKIPPSQVIV